MLFYKKEMSLGDLVQYKKDLEKNLAEGELVPDEVNEMVEVASQLLEGRIDQAARFRQGLMAHIEACKEQLKNMEGMLEVTNDLMKKAVVQSGSNRIDGKSYSLRVQMNGRASTIIDDEMAIPYSFKKVTLTRSFMYTDDEMLYWVRTALGRMVEWKKDLTEKEMLAHPFYRMDMADNERTKIDAVFKIEPSKSSIEEVLKAKPDGVPGAHLEKGSHLRVEGGKAKTKEIANV